MDVGETRYLSVTISDLPASIRTPTTGNFFVNYGKGSSSDTVTRGIGANSEIVSNPGTWYILIARMS